MSDDARRIREELNDARGLADALGLLDGRPGRDWMRQAAGVMVRCPWHDEKTPSCSITTERGSIRVRCFGCDATGDALTLIAEVYHLDLRREFGDVLDLAADLAGVARPERRERREYIAPVRPIVRRPPEPEPVDDGVIAHVASVLAVMSPARRSAQAMEYLAARGLDETEAVNWYALPDGRARCAIETAIVEEVGLDGWMASGLATAEGPRRGEWSFAWAMPRLVIPWRGPDGVVQTLQGRVMGACGERVRKYVFPREHAPRWPYGCDTLAEVAGGDTAVAIVEGVIDALSFNLLADRHGADVRALAIPGVSAWRDEWLRFCARRPCVVALDGDAAGARGAEDIAAALRAVARRGDHGPMVTVRKPARGKDWNEQWMAA